MVKDVVVHHIETTHWAIVLLAFFFRGDIVIFKTHKVSGFVDICVSVDLIDTRAITADIHEIIGSPAVAVSNRIRDHTHNHIDGIVFVVIGPEEFFIESCASRGVLLIWAAIDEPNAIDETVVVVIELGAAVLIGLLIPVDRALKDGPSTIIRTHVSCAGRSGEGGKLVGCIAAVIPLIGDDSAKMEGAIR